MSTKFDALRTGIRDLDKLLGGLERGTFVAVASRPAVGKTAVALTIALKLAQRGVRVTYLSAVMSEYELEHRLISQISGVDAHRFTRCSFTKRHLPKIARARHSLKKLPIRYYNCSLISDLAFIEECEKSDVLVVDDLEGVRMGTSTPEPKRVLKTLKQLAALHGVVVIFGASIKTTVESSRREHDRVPRMTDIRDEVRRFPDRTVLLYRESVYKRDSKKRDIIELGVVEQGKRIPTWTEFRFDYRRVAIRPLRTSLPD